MSRLVHSVLTWFRMLFVVVVDEPATAVPAPVPPKPKVHHDRHSYGSLYFREDLLERLPEYMLHLATMRRRDPDAWALYRRLGGVLSTRAAMFGIGELEPAWRRYRPAFGLVHFSWTDEKEKGEDLIDATLVYYQKVRYPRHRAIQLPPRGMDLYEMSAALIDEGKPVLVSVYVAVDRDGLILPLREKHDKGVWDYPGWVRMLVAEKIAEGKDDREGWNTVPGYITGLFTMVANRSIDVMSGGIQVRATKGKVTASFTIHTERTPYFFADREKEQGETGHTKRIFHIVRTHRRANGSLVPMHYRGLRYFQWHDYSVSVTVPGLHHAVLQEAGFASEFAEGTPPPGYMTSGKAAQMIVDHMQKASP